MLLLATYTFDETTALNNVKSAMDSNSDAIVAAAPSGTSVTVDSSKITLSCITF